MARFVLESKNDGWTLYCILVDTETGQEIRYDGGEPWVPVLLNRLADEIAVLKGKQ